MKKFSNHSKGKNPKAPTATHSICKMNTVPIPRMYIYIDTHTYNASHKHKGNVCYF